MMTIVAKTIWYSYITEL